MSQSTEEKLLGGELPTKHKINKTGMATSALFALGSGYWIKLARTADDKASLVAGICFEVGSLLSVLSSSGIIDKESIFSRSLEVIENSSFITGAFAAIVDAISSETDKEVVTALKILGSSLFIASSASQIADSLYESGIFVGETGKKVLDKIKPILPYLPVTAVVSLIVAAGLSGNLSEVDDQYIMYGSYLAGSLVGPLVDNLYKCSSLFHQTRRESEVEAEGGLVGVGWEPDIAVL